MKRGSRIQKSLFLSLSLAIGTTVLLLGLFERPSSWFITAKNAFFMVIMFTIGNLTMFALDWVRWDGMAFLKNCASRVLKAGGPLHLLKAFRWFLPRTVREDLDIVIADLEEDMKEMKQQKRSRRFIFAVLSWHVLRTITAYFVDGARGVLLKLAPFLRYFSKG
jgi:hypothetical protein